MTSEDVACPFCKHQGFDLIGLKNHYQTGGCDTFENTMSIEEESRLRKVQKEYEKAHPEEL